MKKIFKIIISFIILCAMLQGCGLKKENTAESKITEEMAYEGVTAYCHKEYDWSVAEDDPSLMYVKPGEEMENEYQVIFRSYTGAFVYFYVDKSSGITRITEYEPNLKAEKDIGSINIYNYLGE